jgi:hypothetical protein
MSFSHHTSFRNTAAIQSDSEGDYPGEHQDSAHSSSPSAHHSSSPTSEENPEEDFIPPTLTRPLTSVPTVPDFTELPSTKETLANILFPDSRLRPDDTITLSQKTREVVPDPTPIIAFRSGSTSNPLDIPHDPLINPYTNPIPPTNTTATSTSLSNIIPLQPTFISKSSNPPISTSSRPFSSILPQPQAAIMATPMPHKCDRRFAPRKFQGKARTVESFIDHVERLFQKHGVVTNADKVREILHYCSHNVKEFLVSTEHYKIPNWLSFKADMLKHYDAERSSKRRRPKDLVRLSKKRRNNPCTSMKDWKEYYRKFMSISDALIRKNIMNKAEVEYLFWMGIPPELAALFEQKLQYLLPNHDIGKPYPVDTICAIAEKHFKRDKFTEMMLSTPYLDSDTSSDSDDTSGTESDSESSSSSSDSDYGSRKKHKSHKKKKKQKKRSKGKADKAAIVKEAATQRFQGPEDEIEGMIKQLNTMSLQDSNYGHLYFKVLKMDNTGVALKCITREPLRRQASASNYTPQFVARASPSPAPNPTTYPNNIPMRAQGPPGAPPGDFHCFGCHSPDHMLGDCPRMAELATKGVIIYDEITRKYYMKDKRAIFRRMGECLYEAAIRINSRFTSNPQPPHQGSLPASHLVTLPEETSAFYQKADYSSSSESDSESDEDDGPYWKYALQAKHAKRNLRYPQYAKEEKEVVEEEEESEESEEETYPVYPLKQSAKHKVHRVQPVVYDDSATEDEEEGYQVYPVERSSKRIAEARKEATKAPIKTQGKPVFDGVYPPVRKPRTKPAPVPAAPPPPSPPKQAVPLSKQSPPPDIPEHPQPVDARKVRITENAMDIDARPKPPAKATGGNHTHSRDVPPHISNKENLEKSRGPARQSEISSQIDTKSVANEILDTEIALPLRKILGSSKEISVTLQDMIRPRNKPNATTLRTIENIPRTVENTPRTIENKDNGKIEDFLIKLKVMHDGIPIVAIIDTGSQLNVVREEIAQKIIGMPIDLTRPITMNDANGGEGVLRGFLGEVKLRCGTIITACDLHVGEQVPFDLLLGRPWQCGNYVSIIERRSGTYLEFRDVETDLCQFEVRVSPKMRVARNNIGPYRQAYTFSMTSISLAAKDILAVDSERSKLWVGQVETLRRDLIQGIHEFQARPSTSYDLKRYPAGPNELLFMYIFKRYAKNWPRNSPDKSSTIYSFVEYLIGQVTQDHQTQKAENNTCSSRIEEVPNIDVLPTISEEEEKDCEDTDSETDNLQDFKIFSTLPSKENSPSQSPPVRPMLRRALKTIMSARPEPREPQESDDSSSFSEEEPYGTLVRHPLYSHDKEKWKPPEPHGTSATDSENESFDDSDKENIPPERQNKGNPKRDRNKRFIRDREPSENDRLRILSLIASEAAYLPVSTPVPQPKACLTCENSHFKETCKYKKKEISPRAITNSVHISAPFKPSIMAPSVQTTLGRDLNLQIPPPPPTPTSSSDLTTLAAMVEDFRPVHAPPGDPSLFTCKFNDATLLGYNSATGVTCATRTDLQGSFRLDLDNPHAVEFINSRVPGHLDRAHHQNSENTDHATNNQQTPIVSSSPRLPPQSWTQHGPIPNIRYDSPSVPPTPPPTDRHSVFFAMPDLPPEGEPIPPLPTRLVTAYFRRNERPTYRDPMTFGSAPGLHLHTPHDDGLHEYWPHEQDFLLKISRYFEGRDDLRDGFLIPDDFRAGEYLEGVGEGTRVSLRLPVVEDLLARASRTWPGTIFSIFNSTEPQEPAPLSPNPRRPNPYQFISITPTTQDDELSSTDNDWIYPPTPPRLPSMELPVTRRLEDLHTDDSPPPGLIENTAEDLEIMRVELDKASAALNQPSPPAIEYLDDETLQGESTDEIVRPTLVLGQSTDNTSSPPPSQSAMSSDISSTPASDRHLSPRGYSPPGTPEEPPLGALDDLSNVGLCPNPFAVQVNVSDRQMTRPLSYFQRLHEVTLRRSMGKALANLAPATAIRFGSRVSPRSTTKWAELIPPSQFLQFFPGFKSYAEIERLISTRRANYERIPNRWQSQLTRIRRLRHLVYRVIQDAEHLVISYGFTHGLRDFAVGLDYWHAGLTTNGLLHPREARYFYVLDIFLTQIGVIDLAANTRQLLYARFDNPRDLWTLVHNVVHSLDPPTDDFDLDRPTGIAECNPTDDVEYDKLEELDELVD